MLRDKIAVRYIPLKLCKRLRPLYDCGWRDALCTGTIGCFLSEVWMAFARSCACFGIFCSVYPGWSVVCGTAFRRPSHSRRPRVARHHAQPWEHPMATNPPRVQNANARYVLSRKSKKVVGGCLRQSRNHLRHPPRHRHSSVPSPPDTPTLHTFCVHVAWPRRPEGPLYRCRDAWAPPGVLVRDALRPRI